jgi:hypothetical protein
MKHKNKKSKFGFWCLLGLFTLLLIAPTTLATKNTEPKTSVLNKCESFPCTIREHGQIDYYEQLWPSLLLYFREQKTDSEVLTEIQRAFRE